MRTELHLVSMPWVDPALPSIQVAALKSYIDSVLGDRVTTHAHSAFAALAETQTDKQNEDLYESLAPFEEFSYFLCCVRDFLDALPSKKGWALCKKLKRRINRSAEFEQELDLNLTHRLAKRTRSYARTQILTAVGPDLLTVVGFSLNINQLYSSIYCAKYLATRCKSEPLLHVFGGPMVAYPKVASVLRGFGIEGLCVIGEGEKRLEAILRECLAESGRTTDGLIGRISSLDRGIYSIQDNALDLDEMNSKELKLQVPRLGDLPRPDFSEYFESNYGSGLQRKLKRHDLWIPLEGSRGCFAKCDFCDVHRNWAGFRKRSAADIAADAIAVAREYGVRNIQFVDEVCDPAPLPNPSAGAPAQARHSQ